MLSLRNSCRLFQKSPLSACLLQNSERTLRLYEPEVPNQVEVPDKFRLPIIQKMPPEWMNFAGKSMIGMSWFFGRLKVWLTFIQENHPGEHEKCTESSARSESTTS